MLNLRKVLGAKPKEHVESTLEELFTPWGENLDPSHVLEEHPTPQCARASYAVLNGLWSCAFASADHESTANLEAVVSQAPMPVSDAFDQEILVPFSPEAPLSRVKRQLQPDELLWYRRTLETPALADGARLIIHFQAVDYACALRVNGTLVGCHVGGYTPFSFDITDYLHPGENELVICVADPSEFGGRLRGKQRFDRGDIWYTAQSGIWQTVWMETVPRSYVESIVIEPNAETGVLAVGVRTRGEDLAQPVVNVDLMDAHGTVVASGQCAVDGGTGAVALHVPDVHLWSPSDPYLYDVAISYGDDRISSYCGFRTVSLEKDESGVKRIFLNGKPLFVKGVLDQAYWSDGLMTAPSDEALVFDIEAMAGVGFNLMRKHIKIEAERWYYHCDKMGMLVLQDMVSGGGQEIQLWHWSYKPTLFKFSWRRYRDDTPAHQENLGAGDPAYRDEWTSTMRETIQLLSNHPSIIGWSLFNEGWGQFDARKACATARALDPTRLIDAVSGWYDQRCGDFSSVHNYFRTLTVWPDRIGKRAFFVSEFGGLTYRVDGHSSLEEAYGYETYDDLAAWRLDVRSMLLHMDLLEPKGLAGYIYTQVSDIEEETNGILTYDRRVNKFK